MCLYEGYKDLYIFLNFMELRSVAIYLKQVKDIFVVRVNLTVYFLGKRKDIRTIFLLLNSCVNLINTLKQFKRHFYKTAMTVLDWRVT